MCMARIFICKKKKRRIIYENTIYKQSCWSNQHICSHGIFVSKLNATSAPRNNWRSASYLSSKENTYMKTYWHQVGWTDGIHRVRFAPRNVIILYSVHAQFAPLSSRQCYHTLTLLRSVLVYLVYLMSSAVEMAIVSQVRGFEATLKIFLSTIH